MEWIAIGGLSRVNASRNSEELVDATTGTIASILQRWAELETSVEFQRFLKVSGACLEEAASLRNSVLHARPITVDGEQRLERRTFNRGESNEHMIIDSEWLENTTDRLGELTRTMVSARLPPDGS